MPPKPKFSQKEIVAAALGIVSESGIEALTARALGDALGSSARPIFTVFKNMEAVQAEVRKATMQHFEAFVKQNAPCQEPLFKQIGMQMVKFGIQEPKLYQFLFMQETQNTNGFASIQYLLGENANICLNAIMRDYALHETEAALLFENMWIYTFGIGALCATRACCFSEEEISKMLSNAFQANMLLIKQQRQA